MIWSLSRFRANDVVQVRSKAEILATLDQHGRFDGMPFMPEMLQYCGRRFRVSAVAHKTCDTARQTWKSRRLNATVHLAGLRCDGSAHGGCQAECNLFWKDAWLKLAGSNQLGTARGAASSTTLNEGCTEAQLQENTVFSRASEGEQLRYSCQATQMYEATEPLSPWNPRQYLYDVLTGNCSVGRVMRVVWLAWLRWLQPRVPIGYRMVNGFTNWMHRCLTGRPKPSLNAKIPRGKATPTGRLYLQPGEYVRIKSKLEIEETLDDGGKNRGLSFDPEEMAPYCGRVFKVHKIVTQIIDEPTGKMIPMKNPCIMLQGVVCQSEYASCRLNCPRAIPSYWRELWLERVSAPEEPKVAAPVRAESAMLQETR